MPLKPGDRVVAARSLGLMGGVPKGAPGVVRSVSFLGSYTVDFGEGRILQEVRRDDLRLASVGPLGGGCLLFAGLPCLALAVWLARKRAARRR